MLEFIYERGPFGDETSNYTVKTEVKTVGELIEQVIKERSQEWGTFCLEDKNSHAHNICICEYRYGVITRKAKNFDIYSKAKIISVFANGGWSAMSYAVKVEEYEKLPEQSREEFLYVYFGRESETNNKP